MEERQQEDSQLEEVGVELVFSQPLESIYKFAQHNTKLGSISIPESWRGVDRFAIGLYTGTFTGGGGGPCVVVTGSSTTGGGGGGVS